MPCVIEYGNEEVVKLFLSFEKGIANNNFAMKHASSGGRLEVKLLLKHGADSTVKNNEAIPYTCEEGHIEVVKLLHQQLLWQPSSAGLGFAGPSPGVDPTADDNYAIQLVSSLKTANLGNLLVAKASAKGRIEVVKISSEKT